jgi:replicative DNA helicase
MAERPGNDGVIGEGRGANIPRTLAQVLNDSNAALDRGDLSSYVPIPTGFDPLDAAIGGGLQRGELILLGGAQGIGKTIGALQMARNIVRGSPNMFAFYLSYEHTEGHLMNRLLCMESVNPPEMTTAHGLRMKDLQDLIVYNRAKILMRGGDSTGSLRGILREQEQTSPALARMSEYAERLILLKASSAVTTLAQIRDMAARLTQATHGSVVVFVDYLQKVGIYPEKASDENDRITIVVEGLKDIALSLNIPVLAIVASDREGLKAKRLHLFHLRGSSALDYECDIALIMNNKFNILAKDHVAFNPYQARQYREWVIFTIEKNRAGRAMIDVEFHLDAPFFCFNPQGQAVQQQLIDDKIIES